MTMDAVLERRVQLLKQAPLLRGLSDDHLATLVPDFRLREYQKGEMVVRQGDESGEVFIIIRGKIRVYRTSPGGEETSIDIFGPYDILGEMAALDQQPRSAAAQAICATSVLVMPRERFMYHLRKCSDLAIALATELSHKLRWTAAYAESIAQFDAAGRLLHIVLLYNERFGTEIEPGRRYELDLALTQSDLASMVGARREWVNRILNDWRRRGILQFSRGVITIEDLPRVVAERDSRLEANLGGEEW